MNKPLGMLFDLGDTVLEYYKNTPSEATKRILEVSDNPYGITVEQIQDLAIKLTKETFDRRDEANIEISFQSFQRLLYEYYGIKFKVHISEVEKMFCKYAYGSNPSEGIQELFKTLDALGIKYGALSNSSFTEDTLRCELEEHNLYPNFEFIISSSDYCLRKPNKIIFDLAQRKLGLNAENIWFIGDNYKYDIEGSKNAGMVPIWYNRKNKTAYKNVDCIEVKSIGEITKMITDI
ncbi:MAG: HAD family hydrolase [Clostridium sp.]|uniref:HAD family hydrolase n=1 Tax=Clostridium sp. TaxID=1506 RepID=UPI003072C843